MLNLKKNSNEKKFIRERIIKLTKEYVENFGNNKKSNTINVTGKVINHEEVCNIVDSALDMWLTSGRFNDEFQNKLKKFINIKYLLTSNSGSSANLIALSSLCNEYIIARFTL